MIEFKAIIKTPFVYCMLKSFKYVSHTQAYTPSTQDALSCITNIGTRMMKQLYRHSPECIVITA